MTDQPPDSWEPDPRKMGNWRAMFEQPRGSGPMPIEPKGGPQTRTGYDDAGADHDGEFDPAIYRPWILQRGRSRPAALIDLRWYDARAGMWMGCAMAYPQLVSVEYAGERMVNLDFGKRQFVLEGEGLIELVRRIQDGSVVAIQEYTPSLWPQRPSGLCITSIKRVTPAREATTGQAS